MNIDLVIDIFCENRGISRDIVLGDGRGADVWCLRYMIWHYLHYNAKLSATQLSKLFRRNRPSIFRGVRLLKHQMKYNKELRAEYHAIVLKIEGATEVTPSGNIKERK